MTISPEDFDSTPSFSGEQAGSLIAVSVGNSNTSFAPIIMGETAADLGERAAVPDEDPAFAARTIAERMEKLGIETAGGTAVLASVNDPFADELTRELAKEAGCAVSRVGRDLPIPLKHSLDDNAAPGQDRLLNAVGAHAVLGQACVVVDAGTCVTVDFVDGEGTFHGGAIAPGLAMMLRSMSEGTSSLPSVALGHPGGETIKVPYGKNTEQAMLLGVIASVQGLVRLLTERYAVAYEAYPTVIATGGDADLLFADDELIDRIVPDLTLRGIAVACHKALNDEDDVE